MSSDSKVGKWVSRVRARLSRTPKASDGAGAAASNGTAGATDRPSSAPQAEAQTIFSPSRRPPPATQSGGGVVPPAEPHQVPKLGSIRMSWPRLPTKETTNRPMAPLPPVQPQTVTPPKPAQQTKPQAGSASQPKPVAKAGTFPLAKPRPAPAAGPQRPTPSAPSRPVPAPAAAAPLPAPPRRPKTPPEPTPYKALAEWQPDKYFYAPDPSVQQPDYSRPAGRRRTGYGSGSSGGYAADTPSRSPGVGLYSSGGAYYESSEVWTAPSDIGSTTKMSHYFSPPVKASDYDKPRTCYRCCGALDGSLGDRCTCR